MLVKSLLASAALLAGAAAQKFATYTDSGRSLAINIPDSTASSGSGPIYFQIVAPSNTQWLAFGIGSQMSGATMFVVYSSGSKPVLSQRSASGYSMPQYDSSIRATMLDGSSVKSDGSMIVNVRCDNCAGTNMSPTSSSSGWIMAYKSGSALGQSDTSASISRHDRHSIFTINLTNGIGGSQNPFAAVSASPSSGATATGGSTTATSSVTAPIASNQADSSSTISNSSSSSSSSSNNSATLRLAHGVIMSILFLGFFPFFALTLYLPTANKVRFIHAPLQGLSVILLIVAMALGIVLGLRLKQLDTYHQIIGFIVVFVLVLVQPIMGLLQHLHFHKTGGRSVWGPVHQGVGRGVIILGIVNGGLGWQLAGNTGAYVPYAVISVIVFVIYTGVVIWCMYRAKSPRNTPIDKENKIPNGYEMNNTHRRLPSGGVEQTAVHAKHDRV